MRTFGCWRERGGLEYSPVIEDLWLLEREREGLEYSEVVEALWVLERERGAGIQ